MCQYPTEHRIRQALAGLGSDLGTENDLDEIYSRALNTIRSQEKGRAALANIVLAWLIKARRTLTVDELRVAVTFGGGTLQDDHGQFNEIDMPDGAMMLDICAGLVVINRASSTVQFSHYSVQEYLEKNAGINESAKLELIATTACIKYLQLYVHVLSDELPISTITYSIPDTARDKLTDYAALYLDSHIQACHHIAPVDILLEF